jgi:hypothetical protein
MANINRQPKVGLWPSAMPGQHAEILVEVLPQIIPLERKVAVLTANHVETKHFKLSFFSSKNLHEARTHLHWALPRIRLRQLLQSRWMRVETSTWDNAETPKNEAWIALGASRSTFIGEGNKPGSEL